MPPVVVTPPVPPSPPPAPKPKPPPPAADAKPRVERLNSGPPNHVYEIKGERYEPEKTDVPMVETGLA